MKSLRPDRREAMTGVNPPRPAPTPGLAGRAPSSLLRPRAAMVRRTGPTPSAASGRPSGSKGGVLRHEGPSMPGDPEMDKLIRAEMDLDRRTHALARDFRQAPKEQREKLKADLKKLVSEQFESRQQRRRLEVTRLEQELKRLSEATDRREKSKREIIEKRLSDLLGEEAEPGF